MPYPNEHACRMEDPGRFENDSFRRIVRGKLTLIVAKLKGETSMKTQAFRYPKSEWSEDAARSHCKDQGGSFEAARESQAFTREDEDARLVDPSENPLIRVPGDPE